MGNIKKTNQWKVGAAQDLEILSKPDWDQTAAQKRIVDWATDNNGGLIPSKARRAYLIYDAANGDLRSSYLLPFTDVEDGELYAIDAALQAAVSMLPDLDLPQAVIDKALGVIDGYFKRIKKGLGLLAALEKSKDGGWAMQWKSIPQLYKKISGRAVTGFPSIYGVKDEGDDIVHMGSHAKSIMERLSRIKHLWMHGWESPPTAVIKELREVAADELPPAIRDRYPDATGGLLLVREYLTHDAAEAVFQGIVSGAVTEMSIGFDPVVVDFSSWDQDDDITVRNLRENRLWETSDVLWGMNEATLAAKSFFMPISSMVARFETALSMVKSSGGIDDEQAASIASLGAACNQALADSGAIIYIENGKAYYKTPNTEQGKAQEGDRVPAPQVAQNEQDTAEAKAGIQLSISMDQILAMISKSVQDGIMAVMDDEPDAEDEFIQAAADVMGAAGDTADLLSDISDTADEIDEGDGMVDQDEPDTDLLTEQAQQGEDGGRAEDLEFSLTLAQRLAAAELDLYELESSIL